MSLQNIVVDGKTYHVETHGEASTGGHVASTRMEPDADPIEAHGTTLDIAVERLRKAIERESRPLT